MAGFRAEKELPTLTGNNSFRNGLLACATENIHCLLSEMLLSYDNINPETDQAKSQQT